MAFLDIYRRQVALLIRTLPFVAGESAFALKGGTAINLFVRDMPRLSVDIDLTWLPVADRPSSLAAIDAAMLRIRARIERGIPGAQANVSRSADEKIVTKLIVRAGDVQIKIEVTPVLRGTVYVPRLRTPVRQSAINRASACIGAAAATSPGSCHVKWAGPSRSVPATISTRRLCAPSVTRSRSAPARRSIAAATGSRSGENASPPAQGAAAAVSTKGSTSLRHQTRASALLHTGSSNR